MFNKAIDYLNSKKPYQVRRIVFSANAIVFLFACYVVYKVLDFVF